jgi:hypothetical protein
MVAVRVELGQQRQRFLISDVVERPRVQYAIAAPIWRGEWRSALYAHSLL